MTGNLKCNIMSGASFFLACLLAWQTCNWDREKKELPELLK